jgi:hypothetical protein
MQTKLNHIGHNQVKYGMLKQFCQKGYCVKARRKIHLKITKKC